MVTWENYEEYMMLYVDGELSDAEQKALLNFVRLHPELTEELQMYETVILKPDMTQVYADKNLLLKYVATGKSISLGNWWMYSAAAGVILIVLVMASQWMRDGDISTVSNKETVRNEHLQQPSNNFQQLPTISNHFQQSPTTSNNLQQSPTINQPTIRQEESISIARHSVHSNTKNLVKENASSYKAELKTIQPVTSEIKTEPSLAVSLQPIEIPALSNEIIIVQEDHLLAWLPEEKKQGLQMLKKNIDRRIEKAKSFKDNLKNTELALRLGSQELLVVNF